MYRIIRKSRLESLKRKYAMLMGQARDIRIIGDKNLFRRTIEEADIVATVITRLSLQR